MRISDWSSDVCSSDLLSAGTIFPFMVFAAALQVTGCVEFIMKIAYRIGGHTRAGPAQIAIISSGMMGMVSGSSVANVASTRALTIPLRKRVGSQPEFAAAVGARGEERRGGQECGGPGSSRWRADSARKKKKKQD